MLERDYHFIHIKRLNDRALLPEIKTSGSAGLDLYAAENMWLDPGEITAVGLGFATNFPRDMYFQLKSRSGMALKGIVVLAGVIDSDYTGEWKVIIHNMSSQPLRIEVGQRIAQAVACPVLLTHFEEVETLLETSRGAGGFGSTGS